MAGRMDWPRLAANFAPYTLDLTSNVATSQPPNTSALDGECPVGAFDVRGTRSYCIQLDPATVATSSAVVELQWSQTGVKWISMGSAYQITIPTGTPPASVGWVIYNPGYQFVRVATITAGGAGTAATGTNLTFGARS